MPHFKQIFQGDTPTFRFEFKTKDGSALPEGIAAVFVIESKCGIEVFRNENLLDGTGKADFRISKSISDAMEPGEYRWGVSLKYNVDNDDTADWQTPEGNGKLFVEANAVFPGADNAANAPIRSAIDTIVYEVNPYQTQLISTTNYAELQNKPQINGVELTGNQNAETLGLLAADALADYRNSEAQDLIDDTKFNTADVPDFIITNIGMDTSNLQAVIINTTWWYKSTKQEQTFLISLPFVSPEHPGIAPSELFTQVETLTEAIQNIAKLADVANALNAAKQYTDNQIEAVKNSTLHYVGEVSTFDDLPTDAQLFDLYHVLDTGNGYYWFGSKWNQLDFEGLSIDLSDYYTAAVTDEKIAAAQPGNFSLLKAGLVKGTDDIAPTDGNIFGANDGKLFGENDGTGSFIGWGRLISFVMGLYQSITTAIQRITAHDHSGAENGAIISYDDLTDKPMTPVFYSTNAAAQADISGNLACSPVTEVI